MKKTLKYGLITSSFLALSIGQASAALSFTGTTKATGGGNSLSIGGTITSSGSATSGAGQVLVMTYNVMGLDLSSEEAGATSVSFSYTVTFTADTGSTINFSSGGNVGVDNTQVGGSETLTVAVSGPTAIVGFSGSISLDGITRAQILNFDNTDDQQTISPNSGSDVVLVGTTDNGTPPAPAGAISGVNAAFDAADGVTSVTQSAIVGSAGFRTLRVQFTAVPEPSSTALLGLGGLALIARRTRK